MNHSGMNIRSGRGHEASTDARFLGSLSVAMLNQAPVQPGLASRVFATESISEHDYEQIDKAAGTLQGTLQSVIAELNLHGDAPTAEKRQVLFAVESAAIQGALSAAAPSEFIGRKLDFPTAPAKNQFLVPAHSAPDYVGHRANIFATEAFDNRETRSAVLYTMAYNYSVARQNEFGETVWPTLTLPADQVGFGIVVNRLTVYKGATHTVDGQAQNFGKVDLMRAEADSTVLQKEKTRVFPIFRPAAADKFVAQAVVAAYDTVTDGNTIKTAPIKVGTAVGLLGLSQTDASLQGGLNNQTDTLDPAIYLDNLWIKVANDIIKLPVYSLPTSNFTYAPQANVDKQRNLNFRSKAVALTKNTKQFNGTDLVSLGALGTKGLTVVIELAATGEANTEFGTVEVFGNKIAVVKVLDADKNVLPSTNADVQDIVTAFASASFLGYDLRAWRTNINMRERGDFIDRTSFTQLYEVPLLSPITAQRPQNTDGQLDAGDFEALVTATRFRLKNDAVTALLEATARLKEYVLDSAAGDDIPAAFGAARYHVRPTYYQPDPIDVQGIVDSIQSADRIDDLQSAIVNVIRDYVFRMYVHSEYQAAQDALGQQGPVTVVIATDPTIHRYLMITGELRTLTEKFPVRVVSTLDKRFAGKVFVTFGVFDENRNQAPNLLNWGNLVYAPEVVLAASVPRGESLSRETIVQPRYLFVNHLPVAALLEFVNIPEVLTKVTLNIHNV